MSGLSGCGHGGVDGQCILAADQENTAVSALVHGSPVLRVLGLHIRFVRHDLKAYCLDDLHQFLAARLNAALRLTVAVVIEQWSQVDPDTAWLQDAVSRREFSAVQEN